jgi:hypothetical protein
MDIYPVLASIGSLCCLIIAVTTVEIIRLRNSPFIRATIPVIQVALNLSFIFDTLTAIFTSRGPLPCIPYLWFGFLNVTLLAAGFLAKSWQLLAIQAINKKTLQSMIVADYSKIDMQSSESRESYSDFVSPEEIYHMEDRKRCRSVDDFIYRNRKLATTRSTIMLYFILLCSGLIFPLIVNIIDPVYNSNPGLCEKRTITEIGLLIFLFAIILAAYLYVLIKLWKFNDAYGIKNQVVGMIITWILITLLLLASASIDTDWMAMVYKVLALTVMIPLLVWGSWLPLYKHYQRFGYHPVSSSPSSSSGTDEAESNKGQLDTNGILTYVTSTKAEIGFDSLYSFATQVDVETNRKREDGFFAFTVIFIKNWIADRLKFANSGREFLFLFAKATLYYQNYITREDARHPMIVDLSVGTEDMTGLKHIDLPSAIKEIMDTINKLDADHQEVPEELYSRCVYLVDKLKDAAMEILRVGLFKGYLMSDHYKRFLKEYTKENALSVSVGEV